MSVLINKVEDHKDGSFYVNICIDGRWHPRKFSSMMEAIDCVRHEKDRGGHEKADITLREIIIMATKQLAYESCYSL